MKVYSMKTIEDLLKKFMDGKTTLEEEQLLAQYFRRDDVPDALSDYKEMFRWLECGTTDGTTKKKNMCRKSGKRWWVAAASVLFIVTATFTILQTTPRKTTEVAVASINTDREKETKSEVTITSETANGNDMTLGTTNSRTKTPSPHLKRQASGSTTEYISAEKSIKIIMEENTKLDEELRKMEEEMVEVKKQLVVSQMEANGYTAVYMEDGSIDFTNNNNQIITEL